MRIARESLPNAKVFYEREIGRLTRPDRRSWAKGNCPFHKSKSGRSFSANLITGAFHCFNCQTKGGDVIAFMRQRYGLSFPDALNRLGIDPSSSSTPAPKKKSRPLTAAARLAIAVVDPYQYIPIPPPPKDAPYVQVPPPRPRSQQEQQHVEVRDMIHVIGRIKQETAAELRVVLGGESYDNEAEKLWGLLIAATEALDLYEADYMELAGLEVAR